jgi:succinate dehydrogenase / fumarate reductase iron-sulfur subunit
VKVRTIWEIFLRGCSTEVCPEDIHITDNAIIPLKERVVDEFYDPLLMLVRRIRSAKKA